jgi:hypothetical protein
MLHEMVMCLFVGWLVGWLVGWCCLLIMRLGSEHKKIRILISYQYLRMYMSKNSNMINDDDK